ncbi:unnamed protein product [Soboliphyme baturini]|uniref:Ras family protein n=1 Tax=Soboliphyme baturini TaxID=241478 RepID=A0A183J4H0_9BILA|nr:unnamed protein product [Soboliphyme baturini]
MGFILVYDVTCETSFLNVRDWLAQLKCHAAVDDPDIVLCANKVDLEDIRKVSTQRGMELAAQLQVPYFETSAATGQNVKKAIEFLLELIMERSSRATEVELGCVDGVELNSPGLRKRCYCI